MIKNAYKKDALKQLYKRSGKSMEQIAKELTESGFKVSTQAFCNHVNNSSSPQVKYLLAYSNYFGVKPSYFFTKISD